MTVRRFLLAALFALAAFPAAAASTCNVGAPSSPYASGKTGAPCTITVTGETRTKDVTTGDAADVPATTPSDTATLIAIMKGFWNSFLAPAPVAGTRVVLACSAATSDHQLQAATARNGGMLSIEGNTDNVYIGYGTTAVSSSNHSFYAPPGGATTPLLFGTTGTWGGEIRALCVNSAGTIYLTNGS